MGGREVGVWEDKGERGEDGRRREGGNELGEGAGSEASSNDYLRFLSANCSPPPSMVVANCSPPPCMDVADGSPPSCMVVGEGGEAINL